MSRNRIKTPLTPNPKNPNPELYLQGLSLYVLTKFAALYAAKRYETENLNRIKVL